MRLNRFSDMFNPLIHFHELRELDMSGGLYTWSNNQDFPTLEKLDWILASSDWEDLFPHTMVKKLPREVSNRNPPVFFSDSTQSVRHLQLRFELSWLSNPGFFIQVEKIWNKPCRA
jgi:hypothetical protein